MGIACILGPVPTCRKLWLRLGLGSGTLESLVSERGCSLIAQAEQRGCSLVAKAARSRSRGLVVRAREVLLCSVLERFLGSRIYHTSLFPTVTLYRVIVGGRVGNP